MNVSLYLENVISKSATPGFLSLNLTMNLSLLPVHVLLNLQTTSEKHERIVAEREQGRRIGDDVRGLIVLYMFQ